MIEHYKYYLIHETTRIKAKGDSNSVCKKTINDLLSNPPKFGYNSLKEACSRAFEILMTVKTDSPILNYDEFLSENRIRKIDRINNGV